MNCSSDAQKKIRNDRHKFSLEEDEIIKRMVEKFGMKKWSKVSFFLKGRTARQCRERYIYYLQPHLKNGPWTEEEEKLLIVKYQELGPKWSKLTKYFTSRSDVNLKNHWAAMIRRKKVPKSVFINHLIHETNPEVNIFNFKKEEDLFIEKDEHNLVESMESNIQSNSWKSLFEGKFDLI